MELTGKTLLLIQELQSLCQGHAFDFSMKYIEIEDSWEVDAEGYGVHDDGTQEGVGPFRLPSSLDGQLLRVIEAIKEKYASSS